MFSVTKHPQTTEVEISKALKCSALKQLSSSQSYIVDSSVRLCCPVLDYPAQTLYHHLSQQSLSHYCIFSFLSSKDFLTKLICYLLITKANLVNRKKMLHTPVNSQHNLLFHSKHLENCML